MSGTVSVGGGLGKDLGAKGEAARKGDAARNGDAAREGESARAPRVRLRTVALPVEHGGWSLTLEPVALGLLVAPSLAGLFLAIATAAGFLARHPFKIVAGDRRRGRRFPRTAYAERFLLLYGGVALASALAAFATAESAAFLLPLATAAPLVALQLAYDAAGRSRALLPELAGSVGLASVAASLAMADGWTLAGASALWALMAARAVPSILYVRARLQMLHGETASAALPIVAHAAALGLALALARSGAATTLAPAVFLVLLLRAAAGLRWPHGTAKRVGMSEIFYGLMTVLAVAAARLFG